MGFHFVIKRSQPPPEPPAPPEEGDFIFDLDTYMPPEGDDVDFIFTP